MSRAPLDEKLPQTGNTDGTGDGSATLDFLLRRMRHKSDFPALSDSIIRIQRVANSDSENLTSLSNEILKDVALTHKLLRLVNTAHYGSAGGGTISTVSRAVALVGFAGIRNMAIGLLLLEHMHDRAQAQHLKQEFLRTLLAGTVAAELGLSSRDAEEAFIGAMLQNLGRLLTEFYFPDEASQVRAALAVPAAAAVARQVETEETASRRLLGLSFEELGIGVAKTWGLPDKLQRCMRKPGSDPRIQRGDSPDERLRWLTRAANDVADMLLQDDPDAVDAQVAEAAARYAKVLTIKPADFQAAVLQAQQKLAPMALAMNLGLPACTPHGCLLQTPSGIALQADDTLSAHALQATRPSASAAPVVRPTADVLAAGVQDITHAMVEGSKLNEVLRMVLETMYSALGFQRIVFCLREPKNDTLTGRFGLGADASAVARVFKVQLKGGIDLFSAVCAKGADTLISDATAPAIAARLPPWYVQAVHAPAFLLLPLQMKGAPFALIYADKAESGGIELGEKELALLRTLRNQAVLAFKQVG